MAEPTAEQWAAIRVDGTAAVRAGAGCGKTTVLAHRFLHLLRPVTDGRLLPVVDDVGQILAITFTDKAAAEMKHRIRELLGEEITRATGPVRQRWERVRADLLGAQISTIHAFCARVVRENPLEAGIDPRAAILDEHETRAFVESAVETELVARLRQGDTAARELVLRQRGLRGAIGLAIRFLGRLGTLGYDAVWLDEAFGRQEALVPESRRALAAAARRVVEVIGDWLAAPGRETKSRAAVREAWPVWEARLLALDERTPVEAFLGLRELCGLFSRTTLKETVADDLATDAVRLRGRLAEEYGFLVALPAARRMSDLVGALHGAVQARKRLEGVLTFDDLIAEARRLLADHPAVRERYTDRFRAILVDEFQDTDAVQAALIGLLATGSAFIVGDEKQSIYGFRGADVAVFHAMRARLQRELPLGRNFRSQPAILDFVNALAAATLRRPPGAADPDRWTEFEAKDRLEANRAQTWPGARVRLVTFAAEHARRTLAMTEARELEARVLAGVLGDLVAREAPRVRYGDVAVLFRALTQVKAYEYALRRAAIPYYVVKGRGFFQCQEIRDLVSLLATIADPRDGRALSAVLRSPFFAVDDDTLWRLAWPPGATRGRLAARFRRAETFADLPDEAPALGRIRDLLLHLRRLRSRATIAELVEEALAATDFEAVCLTQFQGGQKVANIRKLIELARDFERRRYFTLRDFVRTVRDMTEREPREAEAQLVGEQDDVVRLMTIHQAKGLEFPVVILVDLGRKVTDDAQSSVIVLDDELGVVAAPLAGAGLHPLRHARLEAHRARALDRTHAEGARLLYVACTRARDELVLLEGKGDGKYLAAGEGDPFVWCHQIWDLLGRDRVQDAVGAAEPATMLPLPGAGEVQVERAERWIAAPGREMAVPPEPHEAPATAAETVAVARVVGFVPPAPAEIVTSPTALADFRRCPRQYWYRHVLGMRERGTGGRRAALLGTAAHGVLETVDLIAVGDDDASAALAARPEALALRPAEMRALGDDLRAAAAALRAEVAAGLDVIGREVPFVLPLPGARPRVFVQGRIDLLARRQGRALVRDYKYTFPSDAAVVQHAGQLAPYQLAVVAAGESHVEAEVVFLRGGVVRRALPALDRAATERALVEAAEALGAATARGGRDAFPKRPPAPEACHALGCGYVARCWGAAAALTRRDDGRPADSAAS